MNFIKDKINDSVSKLEAVRAVSELRSNLTNMYIGPSHSGISSYAWKYTRFLDAFISSQMINRRLFVNSRGTVSFANLLEDLRQQTREYTRITMKSQNSDKELVPFIRSNVFKTVKMLDEFLKFNKETYNPLIRIIARERQNGF